MYHSFGHCLEYHTTQVLVLFVRILEFISRGYDVCKLAFIYREHPSGILHASPTEKSAFHSLRSENDIAAIHRDPSRANGSLLGHNSTQSSFDAASLERLSKTHSRGYVSGKYLCFSSVPAKHIYIASRHKPSWKSLLSSLRQSLRALNSSKAASLLICTCQGVML